MKNNWENTGIKMQVIEELRALAQLYGLEKVILFGSRARGDFYRTSDIDLAVSGGDIVRFSLDAEEETSTLLQFDVVDLNSTLDEELRQSIDSEGRIIFEKV